MPNNDEKPREGALFSLDDYGQKQDAKLHAEMLNTGDHVAAQAASMGVMRRAGLSPQEIAALLPWVLDKSKLDEIRAKRAKPNLKALEEQTKFMSNPDMMRETAAYKTFAKMGERALPLLRGAIQSGKTALMPVLMLLDEITGEQPFADEDRGDVTKMQEAWLDWFSQRRAS